MENLTKLTKIVCVGGGHCNCQVLKILKKLAKTTSATTNVSLTLVTESSSSYYSGMLPGTVSRK